MLNNCKIAKKPQQPHDKSFLKVVKENLPRIKSFLVALKTPKEVK